jgi:phosphopantothenoylcysteine decarboxylase/phosphopantothenate--cysteine ligase
MDCRKPSFDRLRMTQLKGARIFLGVSGGIAAYKAAALTSTLVQRGAAVDVVMTAEAERFITPLTFSSLTARPVYTSLWDAPERIPHIRLIREAGVALVAPATANVIAKLAAGIADDLLTAALLAARIPRIVAPAMNDGMYADPVTQANIAALRARGYEFLDPERGFLAERELGMGRLAAEERLIEALERSLARSQSLRGKRVAITGGPTREPFDPVRFLSNASTGATAIALAAEAARRGARVSLLLGPTLLQAPAGVDVVRVATAQQLYDAAMVHAVGADVIIAAAAVADWRPAHASASKLHKSGEDVAVELAPNPDVLAALGERKGSSFLVGFAAETDDHEASARAKLRRKHLDAIAVNDVRDERGFGTGENSLVLLWGENGRRELGTARKDELAARLLDAVEELMCS